MRLTLALVLCVVTSAASQETSQPHLDRAVSEIQKQVDHFGPNPARFAREFLYATAIMNYVQSRVSPLKYAIMSRSKEDLPTDPEDCLAHGAGICGTQVATYLELARRVGLRARPVEFYLHGATPAENHSHICVEVFYADQWRFVDVTWGTVFRRDDQVDHLMSADEILKTKDVRRFAVTNQTDLWYQQWRAAGLDPLEYVDWKEQDVLYGHAGTVHIRPSADSNSESRMYRPTHQPNHFGRTSTTMEGGTVEVRLIQVPPKTVEATLFVTGLAGNGSLVIPGKKKSVRIRLGEIKPGPLRIDLAQLELDDTIVMKIETAADDQVAYIVFDKVSLR